MMLASALEFADYAHNKNCECRLLISFERCNTTLLSVLLCVYTQHRCPYFFARTMCRKSSAELCRSESSLELRGSVSLLTRVADLITDLDLVLRLSVLGCVMFILRIQRDTATVEQRKIQLN